jgi:hypothetical protein
MVTKCQKGECMEYCPLWKTQMMKIANFVVRRRIAVIFILVSLTVDSYMI